MKKVCHNFIKFESNKYHFHIKTFRWTSVSQFFEITFSYLLLFTLIFMCYLLCLEVYQNLEVKRGVP